MFTKAGGEVQRDHDGEPCPRGHNQPTPCAKCPKVPKWAKRRGDLDWAALRDRADELTPQNRAALDAYREFKATGEFPDDELVRWYSGIIRAAEDDDMRVRASRSTEATVTLLGVLPELLKLKVRG